MRLHTKSDYACRALESLAIHYPNEQPLRIEEIAQRHAISVNYLAQILLELKAKGMIRSHRGKAGGYVLAKPPGKITFGDVLRAIHGEIIDLPVLAEPQCSAEIKRAWRQFRSAAETAADQITFEQICSEANGARQTYHI